MSETALMLRETEDFGFIQGRNGLLIPEDAERLTHPQEIVTLLQDIWALNPTDNGEIVLPATNGKAATTLRHTYHPAPTHRFSGAAVHDRESNTYEILVDANDSGELTPFYSAVHEERPVRPTQLDRNLLTLTRAALVGADGKVTRKRIEVGSAIFKKDEDIYSHSNNRWLMRLVTLEAIEQLRP